MDKMAQRFYQLKQKQKEIEQELSELRSEIIRHCRELEASELEAGSYRIKLVSQERKEYDDKKLQEALPDPELWRLLSKADSAKIASLVKLNVVTEESLKDTYSVKKVTLLQVDRK
ncbi:MULTISPECIES: hypothetical protein [unclassified Paenibacillus]|uniref:hypothetical protein n=1 Tax=unclassified Paenibacillus TaxID=185978 RepID=UPI00095525FD|nr:MULTISPECIES: hypothetical protein [unclassified Paenibacillus]ASS66958.1 hypothetical protein CIC07_13045 [Paenibacillus sp. RUD330]SIR50976.1 hypothetical protein SAMN05880555_4052 [Paenibacillus sp. RU4X]SIR59989.1 hypothetical protein SAMN05880570_4054 [Paenibacillus sp. RU4T]